MVQTNYYWGAPGSSGFWDAQLANCEIQTVTRSGLVHSQITSGDPVSLEYLYIASGGGEYFLILIILLIYRGHLSYHFLSGI